MEKTIYEKQAETILRNLKKRGRDYVKEVLWEFAKKQLEFNDGYITKRTINKYGKKQLIEELKTGKDLNEEIREYVELADETIRKCNRKGLTLEISVFLGGIVFLLLGLRTIGIIITSISIFLVLSDVVYELYCRIREKIKENKDIRRLEKEVEKGMNDEQKN